MKLAIAHLVSESPYSQSRNYAHEVPKLEKEKADDYEKRTWRNRLHTTKDGYVFIPPMAFKKSIENVAKYLSERIPGKGQATYTKHFKAGILVVEPLVLPIKADSVTGESYFVPSNGVSGAGKRVWKTFPVIPEWQGEVKFHILDETITESAFGRHLEQAGGFCGIGYFRPEKGGYWGRFTVKKVKWQNL